MPHINRSICRATAILVFSSFFFCSVLAILFYLSHKLTHFLRMRLWFMRRVFETEMSSERATFKEVRTVSHKRGGYSAKNGGVSWPALWVAKRPYTLTAPTAARAAAPPDVVPVGQSTPRPDLGM